MWGRSPTLIVVDNLMDIAIDGHEEFAGMRAVMKELKYLARDTNAAVLVLHHTQEGAHQVILVSHALHCRVKLHRFQQWF
jgi:RecA-family ATPase